MLYVSYTSIKRERGGGGDSGEKGFQELLLRTHGQNQGGGWKHGFGWDGGEG